jgi:hypothetical protein
VCFDTALGDLRKDPLLKAGNKSGHIDVRELAELLLADLLRQVYHGKHGV